MVKKVSSNTRNTIGGLPSFQTPNDNPHAIRKDRPDKREAQRETAHYIHQMATDLCVMAKQADLDFLAYLIDMARIEAYDRARDDRDPEEPTAKAARQDKRSG